VAGDNGLTDNKITVNGQPMLQGEKPLTENIIGIATLLKDNQTEKRASVEEIMDEEQEAFKEIPKAKRYLLESDDDNNQDEEEIYKASSTQTMKGKIPIPKITTKPSQPQTSSVEEVEDEYWAKQREMPTAASHIIDDAEDWEDEIEQSWKRHTSTAEVLPRKENEDQAHTQEPAPIPPPGDVKLVQLTKWRKHKLGSSDMGVSVLSVKGWVGSRLEAA
jgi:hypothetical protein